LKYVDLAFKLLFAYLLFWRRHGPYAGPDLPIGCVGLSLGPQDPRGPPANCGTHRVNWR